MAGCGFRPSDIAEMTLFDVQALFAYWQDFPPSHEILKLVHGIERKKQPRQDAEDPSGIGSLIARFPDGKARTL